MRFKQCTDASKAKARRPSAARREHARKRKAAIQDAVHRSEVPTARKAYVLFSVKWKREHPAYTKGASTRMAANAWRSLSDSDRQIYVEHSKTEFQQRSDSLKSHGLLRAQMFVRKRRQLRAVPRGQFPEIALAQGSVGKTAEQEGICPGDIRVEHSTSKLSLAPWHSRHIDDIFLGAGAYGMVYRAVHQTYGAQGMEKARSKNPAERQPGPLSHYLESCANMSTPALYGDVSAAQPVTALG